MARVKLSDSDAYVAGGGGFGFFKIGDDGETKSIRLLYNSIDDIPADIVHRVSVDGKTRWVNCLRNNADDPEDMCPLCAAKNQRQRRIFLRVFEITKFDRKGKPVEGDVKYWDRGNTIISDLESLSRRYSPLVKHIFEVERKGARGDMKTSYKFYETFDDDKTLKDFPEEEDILGTIILDKTAAEMDEFIETGSFPKDSDTFGEDERPARNARQREDEVPERRERNSQRNRSREDAEEEEPRNSGNRRRRGGEDNDDEDEEETTPGNRRKTNRA